MVIWWTFGGGLLKFGGGLAVICSLAVICWLIPSVIFSKLSIQCQIHTKRKFIFLDYHIPAGLSYSSWIMKNKYLIPAGIYYSRLKNFRFKNKFAQFSIKCTFKFLITNNIYFFKFYFPGLSYFQLDYEKYIYNSSWNILFQLE